MALKINPVKTNVQGNLMYLFVWALTAVAVVDRALSVRAVDRRKVQPDHE